MSRTPINVVDTSNDYSLYKSRSSALPELFLKNSNRPPTEEELMILQNQLREDKKELGDLSSRIGRESDKIKRRKAAIDQLRDLAEKTKIHHTHISCQLATELEVQRSIKRLSQAYANEVAPSTFATDLQLIHTESTEKAQSVMANLIDGLQETQEREAEKLSRLEESLKVDYVSLSLLEDRKAALEKKHEELLSSVQKKEAFLGVLRRVPTEILAKIFLETLEVVVLDRINNPMLVPVHPTLAIVAVCQRWREIALATRDLWRYVPIYTLPPLDMHPQLPMPMGSIYERAMHSKEVFIDWTRSTDNHNDRPMHRLANILKSMAIPVNLAKLDPRTTLTIFFSGESPLTLHVRFFVLEYFIFHNIYPDFNRESARHVRGVIMHFRERPKLKKLIAALSQFPDLVNLEIHFEGKPHRQTLAPGDLPSLPKLQSLSLRLSMVPVLLNGEKSISASISSLKVYADFPPRVTFLTPDEWLVIVESSGLATSLRRLELDESTSSGYTTTYMTPLLLGLRSVERLSLHGGFMWPILDILSQDRTLLPCLHRVEMHFTDIEESVIESFLASRQSSCQSTPARIREVLFDYCSSATRDLCDRVQKAVDKLTVYC